MVDKTWFALIVESYRTKANRKIDFDVLECIIMKKQLDKSENLIVFFLIELRNLMCIEIKIIDCAIIFSNLNLKVIMLN